MTGDQSINALSSIPDLWEVERTFLERIVYRMKTMHSRSDFYKFLTLALRWIKRIDATAVCQDCMTVFQRSSDGGEIANVGKKGTTSSSLSLQLSKLEIGVFTSTTTMLRHAMLAIIQATHPLASQLRHTYLIPLALSCYGSLCRTYFLLRVSLFNHGLTNTFQTHFLLSISFPFPPSPFCSYLFLSHF